jgi:hypothetical protein
VSRLSPRQTTAALSLALALGLTACYGGDATPTDPAQEAPAGNDLGPGPAGGGVDEPVAPDPALDDPGDDLEEPAG